jgi:hypothetical protein
MRRRDVLATGLALTAASAIEAPATGARALDMAPVRRVRPGQPGWPGEAAWARLNAAVGGRLSPVMTPDLTDPAVKAELGNPYFIADQPGLTESCGWLDAWRSSPSAYMVAATSAADIAAAVRFARVHNLRLVVKGRGHSYLGASNAPDSLLIWTRHMDDVTVHDAFTPEGSGAAPVPAVSCGMWMHAYKAVTVEHGRYVQGGGCPTVGVAGLVQGGGFGSFSKGFGTAGSHLLEAEIVTADGQIRVANEAKNPELFWALTGGGGGTFGVVTRLTLATHALPGVLGAAVWAIPARSDEAYRRLLAKFVEVYAQRLFNPNFGEQARAGPENVLSLGMSIQGIKPDEVRGALQPLIDFVAAHPDDYEGQKTPMIQARRRASSGTATSSPVLAPPWPTADLKLRPAIFGTRPTARRSESSGTPMRRPGCPRRCLSRRTSRVS